MGETLRTFLAIPVTSTVRSELASWQTRLRGRFPDRGVTWVDPEHFHITLVFLGDVEWSALNRLSRVVETACDGILSVSVSVQGLGGFPSLKRPRGLWAGLEGASVSTLTSLNRRLVAGLEAMDIPTGDDRFHSHITIARIKTPRGRRRGRGGPVPQWDAPADASTGGWTAGPLVLDAVQVMSSELTPQGPRYQIQYETRLARSDTDSP